MRLPGTLKALSEQLEAVGWGAPQELRFDAEGNLIGLALRPPPAGATSPVQTPLIPRRGPSPLSIHGRPPEKSS